MKQYSSEYFRKKYKILFNKLTAREDFLDEIKKTRKELDVPVENGFSDTLRLAEYFTNRLNKKEKESLTLASFIEQYRIANNISIEEESKDSIMDNFFKEYETGISILAIMVFLQNRINNHCVFYTRNDFISVINNKTFSKIFEKELALFFKFVGIDLLDDHIAMQFIEKYLFLGDRGVDAFIESRVACPECKYIGVKEFSPNRMNMDGKDKGPFNDEYVFNKETVKRLSRDFDSVFLIIKPYATKEEVIQYVEDNWGHIKDDIIKKNGFYRQLDVHPAKIKESDMEKNRLIYELYKLSKKDLLKRYKGNNNFNLPGIYKEAIISAILREEYGIDMSSDAIKKNANRFKKNSINKTIKDIRDI